MHRHCRGEREDLPIGGVVDGKVVGLSTMEVYDPATDTWTKKADMPTPRYIYGPSAVNGKIYAIGGWVNFWGNQRTSTVEEYDIAADTWTKKTDMPTSRSHLSTSVVNGKIYAVGGRVGPDIPLSTVEMYDPVTDTWIKKAGMPTPRMSLSTSVVDGKIYAIGGTTALAWDAVALSTVEAYDPTTDTWTRKADIPTPRGIATCVVDGKIYAIGGDSTLVEVYDPAKDEWTKDTDLPFGNRTPGASVVNGKIYVIGGMRTPVSPCLSTVLEYDTGFRITPVAPQGKKAATWGKLKHSR
jgi:N-acetylneuraminic acid mutarotase